ncbi:hypothetical protein [Lysobacter claricitrinus]|uniref:hypothetical protein n=1 Tax=Lysobacter claricitrinus TaxID=3367728 RepID=UPI0037DABC91
MGEISDVSRPKTLVAAIALLAATHVYGIAVIALVVGTLSGMLVPSIALIVAIYSLLLMLLVFVWLGHDWARLVCGVVAFLAVLVTAPRLLSMSPLATCWFVAKAAGLFLLYVPPTNRWFRSAAPNNSSKPTPLRGAA